MVGRLIPVPPWRKQFWSRTAAYIPNSQLPANGSLRVFMDCRQESDGGVRDTHMGSTLAYEPWPSIIVKPYRLVVWGKRLLAVRKYRVWYSEGTPLPTGVSEELPKPLLPSEPGQRGAPIKRSRNSHENNPSVPRTNSHSLYAECMRNPVSSPLEDPVVIIVIVH